MEGDEGKISGGPYVSGAKGAGGVHCKSKTVCRKHHLCRKKSGYRIFVGTGGCKARILNGGMFFHGYGVRKHVPTGWLPENMITFNVNAHGMELGSEEAYYDQLKEDLKSYAFDEEENANPETAYFHDMSLRVMRAFEYVKSLLEWDGKNLESNGGSQGGLQGLWGAGLDPDVSSTNNWSPCCCDMSGDQNGRMEGWQPKYSEALAYYDPVYHVRRTQAKLHLIANLGDYTCPPSGVLTVYNEIPDAGHIPSLEQPKLVIQNLKDFLGS